VNGKPLLGHWLDLFERAGIERVLINLHHLDHLVRDYVTDRSHTLDIEFAYEAQLLGTAGTIQANRGFLESGSTLVAHADNLSIFSVAEILAAHRSRPTGVVMTMMTFYTDRPSQCGIVEVDERGVVVGFHEKRDDPPGNLANGAVYIMEPEILDTIDAVGGQGRDLSIDVVPRLLGRIATFHNGRYHRDLGTMDELVRAQLDYPLHTAMFADIPGGDAHWSRMLRSEDGRLARDLIEQLRRDTTGADQVRE
jgi:mannose-1-phosphate guanylyltransferase